MCPRGNLSIKNKAFNPKGYKNHSLRTWQVFNMQNPTLWEPFYVSKMVV